MADWPLLGDGQLWFGGPSFGSIETSTSGRLITCGQNVDTGTTVQLFDATALTSPASGLLVTVWRVTGGASLSTLSIGYDTPLTSANRIISHLLVQPVKVNEGYDSVYIPVTIPALTAVYANGRSQSTGVTYQVSVQAVGAGSIPSSPLSVVTSYGLTALFTGTLLTPTGVANGKSTPVGLGTTTRPIRELIIALGCAGIANRSASQMMLLNIYAGGQYIVRGLPVVTETGGDDVRPKYVGPIPVAIPEGVALTADIRNGSTNVDSVRIALYGVS